MKECGRERVEKAEETERKGSLVKRQALSRRGRGIVCREAQNAPSQSGCQENLFLLNHVCGRVLAERRRNSRASGAVREGGQ